MAGINNQPGAYDPFLEKKEGETDEAFAKRKEDKMQKIKNRTIVALQKMKQLGKITEDEFNKAKEKVNNGLDFKKGQTGNNTQRYSHIVDGAINEVIDRIAAEKDIKKEAAEIILYNGGYKIYTTQNTSYQGKLEEEMKKDKYVLKSRKNEGKIAQAAAVITDHKTGEIVAAVGGLGDQTTMTRGDWNRVTRTKRQNGSSMKPLTVVSAGLETGKLTAGSVYNDAPIQNMGYKNYTGSYKGYMTVREAIRVSQNLPMIRALREVGVDKAYEFGKKLGLPLVESDKNEAALALRRTYRRYNS